MEKNKSLQKINENMFTKIFNFIKKLFYRNKDKTSASFDESNSSNNMQQGSVNVQLGDSGLSSSNNDAKNEFLENIRVIHSEKSELLKLQKDYEDNKISIYDLSPDQLRELNILYQRQVSTLKKQIEDTKTEIKIVQYGLKNKNVNA